MGTEPSTKSGAIDVRYVAHLARLNLTDEEAAKFQGQLESILNHVRELEEVDIEGVEPTAHAIPVENVLRPDGVKPGLDHDVVMKNAPAKTGGQFLVPKILE